MQQIVFYVFAGLVTFAGLMLIFSRNPVRAALFLVMCFVAMCPLWLMLEDEFLALVLVFVYVGAVMTLFLFVVMMLNLDESPKREGFVRYLPIKLLVCAFLLGLMFYVISTSHFSAFHPAQWVTHGKDYSNTAALGKVLYTKYAYAFELAAILLLIAIVAAISLAFRGLRSRKAQRPADQINVKREDRARMVKMQAEKRE